MEESKQHTHTHISECARAPIKCNIHTLGSTICSCSVHSFASHLLARPSKQCNYILNYCKYSGAFQPSTNKIYWGKKNHVKRMPNVRQRINEHTKKKSNNNSTLSISSNRTIFWRLRHGHANIYAREIGTLRDCNVCSMMNCTAPTRVSLHGTHFILTASTNSNSNNKRK